jgi:hypothetical protein
MILELAGLSNAAREIGLEGNPPIDHETILALAPDLFVVASTPSGTDSPATDYLRADAKLAALPAIREGRIAVLPLQLFSTASQHLLDAAEALAEIVDHLPPVGDEGGEVTERARDAWSVAPHGAEHGARIDRPRSATSKSPAALSTRNARARLARSAPEAPQHRKGRAPTGPARAGGRRPGRARAPRAICVAR